MSFLIQEVGGSEINWLLNDQHTAGKLSAMSIYVFKLLIPVNVQDFLNSVKGWVDFPQWWGE